MSPAITNLLEAIRKYEGGPGPRGYGQVYSGMPKRFHKDVSKMRLSDILKLQQDAVRAGSRSSAVGGYQFLRKTLLATMAALKMLGDGNKIWTPELQDQMAMHLLRMRGLDRFLKGVLSREDFANSLAAEWASLPMVTGPKTGRSKYAGDGLNKSHHSVASILALLDAVKAEAVATKG